MEGSKVFVPDDVHGWLGATLVTIHVGKKEAEVELQEDDILGIPGGESRTVDLTRPELRALADEKGEDGQKEQVTLPLQNLQVPDRGVEDMCSLSFLHVRINPHGHYANTRCS